MNFESTHSPNLSGLLAAFLDNVRDPEARSAVGKSLVDANIGLQKAHFGDRDGSRPESHRPGLETVDMATAERFVSGTSIQLDTIYRDRQRKVGRIFNLLMVVGGLAVLLVIAGFAMNFWQNKDGQTDTLKLAGTLLPTFASAMLFSLYKKESAGIAPIEAELIKTRKLEEFFRMARTINDPVALGKAYEALIGMMIV